MSRDWNKILRHDMSRQPVRDFNLGRGLRGVRDGVRADAGRSRPRAAPSDNVVAFLRHAVGTVRGRDLAKNFNGQHQPVFVVRHADWLRGERFAKSFGQGHGSGRRSSHCGVAFNERNIFRGGGRSFEVQGGESFC